MLKSNASHLISCAKQAFCACVAFYFIPSEIRYCYQVLYHCLENKLQKQVVQDVVNINKIKFDPYGDYLMFYSKFNETLINIFDLHSQIANDETQGAQYPNKMTQKIQKQAKLMQLPTLCKKYYWMMKS